jgi:hypothetical protein
MHSGFGRGIIMLTTRDWSEYRQWHELLDVLCAEQGYLDNMALADALCAVNGNRTQAAFDTALKNLRNWRGGVHVPQRRNFLLLTKLLGVDKRDGLKEHWNRLYGASRKPEIPDVEDEAVKTAPQADGATLRKMRWMLGGASACILTLVGFVVYLVMTIPAPGEIRTTIDYYRYVDLQVGESKTIHGKRGACGKPAPGWDVVERELPPLTTGHWSDGGEGLRYSRNCSSLTPARGVTFTAVMAGVDEINLYGDDISIRVTE